MKDKWKPMIRNKIYAHQYSYANGDEFGHCKRIEAELEEENYHRLLKLLIAHKYEEAYDWLDKE